MANIVYTFIKSLVFYVREDICFILSYKNNELKISLTTRTQPDQCQIVVKESVFYCYAHPVHGKEDKA